MKLRKFEDKKSLLGTMWHIVFENRWVYTAIMYVGHIGAFLIALFLLYLSLKNENYILIAIFLFMTLMFGKSLWKFHNYTGKVHEKDTLGEKIMRME